MYCTQCGTKLPDTAQFCSGCGAAVAAVPDDSKSDQLADASTTESDLPEEFESRKAKHDRKAPPRVSPVTVILAVIGLLLILVLLHPWHTGQERPKDFQGNRNQSNNLIPHTIQDYPSAGFPILSDRPD